MYSNVIAPASGGFSATLDWSITMLIIANALTHPVTLVNNKMEDTETGPPFPYDT